MGIYGEHAGLLDECEVTEYRNATPLVNVQLRHLATGTKATAVGRSVIMTKREALEKIAARLANNAKNICQDCGCWTGGADCPYCVPGAPHPRGRC
ncbi:MAG TPA: hypothetical protein PLB92_00490 [Rhodoglobus sp.]|nr:hypothetical protein [Rhodoglobus sp.]